MTIRVKFWGVRGSIAAPGADTALYGGNTACVDIRCDEEMIVLDAGTGLRPLGVRLGRTPGSPFKNLHLLLSHFHIDHMAGLPFFSPLYQKGVTLNLYGPAGYRRPFEKILSSFFSEEFFPVPIRKIPATLRFHPLGNEFLKIGPFKIHSFYVNHPGHTLGYRIQASKRSLAYVTDHEPITEFQHIEKTTRKRYQTRLLRALRGVDLLIHDAHFTNEEYERYRGWGHSPLGYPVRLAEEAQVKHLVLFHHSPEHRDGMLSGILKDLEHKLRRKKSRLRISLAQEGRTITL